MMPVTLTPRERQHLKARAHSLEPSVRVGHAAQVQRVGKVLVLWRPPNDETSDD
jgi:RNA-binding protein YhbY